MARRVARRASEFAFFGLRRRPFESTTRRPLKVCFVLVIIAPTIFLAHNLHIQMDSKDRKQLELLVGRTQPHVEEVTPQLISKISRKATLLDAWNMSIADSELEDKQIYGALQIDASHWTKIKNGVASPPADQRFVQFMDVVGNEYPLIWLAVKRGYDWLTIRKQCSDLERENQDLKRELEVHKRAVRLLLESSRSAA